MFSRSFGAAFSGGAGQGARLICAQRAQAALLAGAPWVLGARGLDVGGALLVGLSGRPMNFKSEETAAMYVLTVTLRAASESGIVANLPDWAFARWAGKKAETLRRYAERVWASAAKHAAGSPERAALMNEASAADARADALMS